VIDLKAICDALAARFAAGTISTPSGSLAMRKSYAQPPKNLPTVPAVILEVNDGDLVANPGQWKHEIHIDVVFCYSKRQGDTVREDAERQRWLGTLLAATQAQMKLGLGSASSYTVDKAVPDGGWEFIEYEVGGASFDAIRVKYTVYVTETVTLTP